MDIIADLWLVSFSRIRKDARLARAAALDLLVPEQVGRQRAWLRNWKLATAVALVGALTVLWVLPPLV